jgi:hypothetical protein
MTFIRGPVCEGQVAVNVIRDHFFSFFIDPDQDLSVIDSTFLKKAADLLDLPAKGKSSPFESYYESYKEQQKKYLAFRAKRYSASKIDVSSLKTIWDGDGEDRDAALTIFRHFDNSSVIKGLSGGTAQTVWVMDYPIFQRMYYLLAAGFNVFGNVFHQSSTRMYMDNLRVEAENNFLYLIPQSARKKVRQSWYKGEDAQEKMKDENELFSRFYKNTQSVAESKPQDIVDSVVDRLKTSRLAAILDTKDPYNCSGNMPETVHRLTCSLVKSKGEFRHHMPEVTMLSVTDKKGKSHLIFLSKLTGHLNVAFMFQESERLDKSMDRVIATKDWVGSYANFIGHMSENQYKAFVSSLLKAKNKKEVEKALVKHGASRLDRQFWAKFDVLDSLLKQRFPIQYGKVDLSKYESIY